MKMDDAECIFKATSKIQLPKDATFEMIASQLQKSTDVYLYVIDGVILSYYRNLDEVKPGNRQFEPTAPSSLGKEYYIRDLEEKHLICCFDLRLAEKLLVRPLKQAKIPIVRPISPIQDPIPELSQVIDMSSDIEKAQTIQKIIQL